MKYRHLFFDLDHTLWDFETNAKETLYGLYETNRLQAMGIYDFELFFQQYSFHNERLWDRYTKGLIKHEELRWKRMWFALLDFQICDEVLSKELAGQFLEYLPSKKNLFPYALEILQYLTGKGYKLHLVTNGFEEIQLRKLSNTNLHSYFVEIITSETSRSLKPSKEIFEYALNKCKACKEECIMIGDSLDADIQGAINAGIDTVFVNHLNIKANIQPTYTVYHLKELELIF